FVAEHADALSGERGAHHRAVGPVVVVAEDREDAMRGAQAAQGAGARGDVVARMRDVISGKRHQVGAQAVRHAHGLVDSLFVQKRGVMDVGKLDDSQTPKFGGEVFYSDCLMSDLDLMWLDHRRPQDCGESLTPLPTATAAFG